MRVFAESDLNVMVMYWPDAVTAAGITVPLYVPSTAAAVVAPS